MLIRSFGLFWRVDEIEWNPGQGAKDSFRLLGRQGSNLLGLRVADFRHQTGIYILYGDYGPYYVGKTLKRGLGNRLKDHRADHHQGKWDRFSWFGFRAVLKCKDGSGLCSLKNLPQLALGSPEKAIRDIEALLIKAMGPRNIAQMSFSNGTEWLQIEAHETEKYLCKLK